MVHTILFYIAEDLFLLLLPLPPLLHSLDLSLNVSENSSQTTQLFIYLWCATNVNFIWNFRSFFFFSRIKIDDRLLKMANHSKTLAHLPVDDNSHSKRIDSFLIHNNVSKTVIHWQTIVISADAAAYKLHQNSWGIVGMGCKLQRVIFGLNEIEIGDEFELWKSTAH